MNLRIPGMNGSSDGQQPLSASGGLDLSGDLGSPEPSGLLSDLPTPDAFSASGSSAQGGKTGILLLIGVVVAAGAALYAMRHIGMTGLPDFGEEIKINYPLERSEKKFEEDYQNLIEDLRGSDRMVQVPLEEVVMNPFTWKGEADAMPAGPIDRGPGEREREIARMTEQRNREISFTLGRLRFTGVMGRRARTATVDGQLVREGDTVADCFRVQEIRDRELVLVALPSTHKLASGETITITPQTTEHVLSLDTKSP